jgi:hypothetical protein
VHVCSAGLVRSTLFFHLWNFGPILGDIELEGVKQILQHGHIDLHLFVWIGFEILECSTDILDRFPRWTNVALWNVFSPLNVLSAELYLFAVDPGCLLALAYLAIVGGHD